MALTLFSFIGITIVQPDFFGMPDDPENKKAIYHIWRVIGFMLGIEDQFNVFDGHLETITRRSQAILTHIFTPALLNVPPKFEHMTFVAMDGIKALSLGSDLKAMKFLFNMLCNIPGYYLNEKDRQVQLDYIATYPHYIGDTERIQMILKDIHLEEEECVIFKEKSFMERFGIRNTVFMVRFFSKTNLIRKIANAVTHFMFNFLVNYPIVALMRFGKKYAYINNSVMESYLADKRIAQ